MVDTVDNIQSRMREALRAERKEELATLRLALAAVQREIKDRGPCDEMRLFAILDTLIKQRREAADLYDEAGRAELAAKERAEIPIIESLLPPPMQAEELQRAIDEAIAESGASGPADMGKVMSALKKTLTGRIDMRQVSAQVKTALGR